LDNRSFRLNDEPNLDIFDTEFALQQSQKFADERRRSKLVTFKKMDAQSIAGKRK
jgi:cardiolipin synthase